MKKKILFVSNNFLPFIGGAEKSMFNLLQELKNTYDIHCIYKSDKNLDFRKFGLSLHTRALYSDKIIQKLLSSSSYRLKLFLWNKEWEKILRKFVPRIKPDIVISMLEIIPAVVKVAKEKNIPVISFVYDIQFFSPLEFENKEFLKRLQLRKRISYKLYKNFLKIYIKAIKNSDSVISVSDYVSNLVKKFTNTNSSVFYPFVNLKQIKSQKRGDKITLVNLQKVKGARIFLEIAKRRPEYSFLAVGRADKEFLNEAKKIANINYFRWLKPNQIYNKTKILLSPNLVKDAGSTVILEAGINKIPTVGSHMGATPEFVNGGLIIDNVEDINCWLTNIDKLMKDTKFYKKYSNIAYLHSKKLIGNKKKYNNINNLIKRLIK